MASGLHDWREIEAPAVNETRSLWECRVCGEKRRNGFLTGPSQRGCRGHLLMNGLPVSMEQARVWQEEGERMRAFREEASA